MSKLKLSNNVMVENAFEKGILTKNEMNEIIEGGTK